MVVAVSRLTATVESRGDMARVRKTGAERRPYIEMIRQPQGDMSGESATCSEYIKQGVHFVSFPPSESEHFVAVIVVATPPSYCQRRSVSTINTTFWPPLYQNNPLCL
jgi:hypothetical protein